MKKSRIIVLIYDNKIYFSKNDDIESINIESDIIKQGRINNISKLVKIFKKSNIYRQNYYKVFNNDIILLYLGDYNDLELKTIKQTFADYGIYNISLIDCFSILNDNYCYLFMSGDYIYYYYYKEKALIRKNLFNSHLKVTNSKIICDINTFNYADKYLKKLSPFIIDNTFRYMLKHIC